MSEKNIEPSCRGKHQTRQQPLWGKKKYHAHQPDPLVPNIEFQVP